ncbi:DUF2795 domain-containing protein [Salinispora arenicola]|uniref:Uncharacterized protein DUF2795 n=2 Tax=Salinispora arenicola TaxID=168697 RepID=A0A542XN41_SALAC|nr:DUF2795 domain-containing protein [Salinispora arenicola]MCN0152184.1 DUF2795 domain-containing protein [Salinispora arenicola]MCN0177483.1 DUF2795 domain-containing protein [Salinispora arenicola]NIL39794.1 DUF2795 domain-containing protein [Salinispora arenicola]NIL57023.1 DUF2795 domain-containing protein [Salinispora arenicola]NIL61500.1 DUF2795 domain-containing protein [Salinispora arenicola]
MTVSGVQLQEYIAALDYPVSREDLVRWGQENGVSTEMLQMLRLLPGETFDSPEELSEALNPLA